MVVRGKGGYARQRAKWKSAILSTVQPMQAHDDDDGNQEPMPENIFHVTVEGIRIQMFFLIFSINYYFSQARVVCQAGGAGHKLAPVQPLPYSGKLILIVFFIPRKNNLCVWSIYHYPLDKTLQKLVSILSSW